MPDFGRWSANGGDPSLNEINRTDRFLDALASQQPVYSTDPGEAELAQLLAGWRDDVRTPPLMSPVTPRDASVALRRALEARKRTRTSMAVVGSVAAAVLCLGGLFGAHADDYAQNQDLALFLGQHCQESVHPRRRFRVDGHLLGPGLQREPLRDDIRRLGAVPGGCAVRVSNLVRSDAVHKGQERSSLILVARQRRDGGQAHLLSNVIR